MRRLYWYATLVVLTHAAVVLWHLELLARLGTALKVDQVPLFAGVANIIPLIALISLWAHFPRLSGWLLLFLAGPLVIGGYSHFLSRQPFETGATQTEPCSDWGRMPGRLGARSKIRSSLASRAAFAPL
jgi:hypothetical protein